ncbi:hypothetical protein [Paraburkholderia tropica]|uniref:hypothetical protein n=1 Tax=Paraburkholderia tropica TaxID=92647 RepID=UPI002AB09E2D|nr:hypothetical protein [Paraburkholderia tropica]
MRLPAERFELPTGVVVLSADGTAQFGWQHPETGDYYAEDDGSCIMNAIGAAPWQADTVH